MRSLGNFAVQYLAQGEIERSPQLLFHDVTGAPRRKARGP